MLLDLKRNVYLLNRLIPGLLGQIDRDPDSPTYGSCDRNYWMYRIHDFESGVLQQQSLTLAIVATIWNTAASSCCDHAVLIKPEYVRSIAHAVCDRTAKLLISNGFLDEYYPGERSFPGTVFAAYATLKAAQLLGFQDIIDHEGIHKCAREISKKEPTQASNQNVAAAAFLALYNKSNSQSSKLPENKIGQFLFNGNDDCLFSEYGGGDLGYSTVTLHYLACMAMDGTYTVDEHIKSLAYFVSDFVTPRGTLGGEFASRSTAYFIPYGLIIAAEYDDTIAIKLGGLDTTKVYEAFDDRYLDHYALPSLALTIARLSEKSAHSPFNPSINNEVTVRDHRERGLIAISGNGFLISIGINKGGTFQIDTVGSAIEDCGYRLYRNGNIFSTSVIGASSIERIVNNEDRFEVTIRSAFMRYRSLTASPFKTIVLRLFRLLGPAFNAYFKKRLIQKSIHAKDVQFERTLSIKKNDHVVHIVDSFEGLTDNDVLKHAAPGSPRLVPSARFFRVGEDEEFLKSLKQLDKQKISQSINVHCI